MIGGYKPVKISALGTDGGGTAVAWVEFGIIRPGKDSPAKGHQTLGKRFGGGGMARPTRKNGIAHDGLTIEAQAHAARCMTGHMNDPQAPAAQLNFHAIQEWKVTLYAKCLGIGGVDTHGNASGPAHSVEGADVIGMSVGEQDASRLVVTHCLEDSGGVRTGIDDGQGAGVQTAHQVAVHRPGTDLQTMQFQCHGRLLL
jgi:hypothetical protein